MLPSRLSPLSRPGEREGGRDVAGEMSRGHSGDREGSFSSLPLGEMSTRSGDREGHRSATQPMPTCSPSVSEGARVKPPSTRNHHIRTGAAFVSPPLSLWERCRRAAATERAAFAALCLRWHRSPDRCAFMSSPLSSSERTERTSRPKAFSNVAGGQTSEASATPGRATPLHSSPSPKDCTQRRGPPSITPRPAHRPCRHAAPVPACSPTKHAARPSGRARA